MQIGEQVIDLFVSEHVAEAFHLVAPHTNNIPDPVVVGRHSAGWEVVPFEDSPQTRPLALPRRIRRVAAIAILIVDMPSCGLAGRQAKFGIAFTALDFASAGQRKQRENCARDGGTFQTLDIQKWKLQTKNLNHSMEGLQGNFFYRINNYSGVHNTGADFAGYSQWNLCRNDNQQIK